MKKTPIEAIVAAYEQGGSVWAAGKIVGLAGQSVHERLVAINYPLEGRNWTDAEVAELRRLVEDERAALSHVAHVLGRPYGGVAGKASNLGIRNHYRPKKKLPRGAGLSKAGTRSHLVALENYSGNLTQYSRANGMKIDLLVLACEKHFPERWETYVRERGAIPQRDCEYCGKTYVPNSGRQRFCSRKCNADWRADTQYFGGRRRETVGLAAGICQLCGRENVRGLSSHHVLGKENDPENDVLIALCPGCHQLVSQLATRKFDAEQWEALISLALLRRYGDGLPDGADTLTVYVDVETYAEEPA